VLWLLTGAAFSGPSAAPPRPAEETAAPEIALSSAEVETGGVVLVGIDAGRMKTAPRSFRVTWEKQAAKVFANPAAGRAAYAAFLAAPLGADPGRAVITIEWVVGGKTSSRSLPFEIRAGDYGSEALTVDPRHVRPSTQELARIRREQLELGRIYASGSPSPLWQGRFVLPVPGEVNGRFGTRRLFNGELRSHHTGVDFRAPAGEPVRSTQSGVVRLAKELFYSGNAVVVDHGAGVFSSYSHLSRIEVAPGQKIEKGRVLGQVGATGRATGPHLHWGVKLNAVSVNPLAFVEAAGRLGGD
jgi:murein DD-endopeptidase MepM/ murein hydrolase activator NlpD